MTQTALSGLDAPAERVGIRRLLWLASIELFVTLGVLTLIVLFIDAAGRDIVAIDLWQFYVAAEAILHGASPYLATPDSTVLWGGPYPYPPLPALVVTPLTLLSFQTAGFFVMALLVLVALAVPYVLGVRDWRCYGIMFMWPSVIQAIQTGNVTLGFALAAAVAWRFRDRPTAAGVSIGVTLATKFYLWPLVVWLAATRRLAAGALAVIVGMGLLVASWAVIGFVGLTGYPALVRQLEHAVAEDSYTVYALGLDLGLPSVVASALWLAVGIAVLAWVVVLARRGDEKSAFIVAIGAALALTPIVWLHYFALLLVVVAIAQPRFGLLWFVPLGMFLTPGSGDATAFRTAWTLAVAALVVALAVRATRAEVTRAPSAVPRRLAAERA
jgi:hypothetical protein